MTVDGIGPDAGWEGRVDAFWKTVPGLPDARIVEGADALAAERPAGDAAALFERACARDSAGLEHDAEPLYRAALATGRLDAYRTARASIQLGSTLRILGRLDESESLLLAQWAKSRADPAATLLDEVRAVLAFTWLAQGKAEDAACLALETLAPHLSRYNRSMAANARALARW